MGWLAAVAANRIANEAQKIISLRWRSERPPRDNHRVTVTALENDCFVIIDDLRDFAPSEFRMPLAD